MCLSCDQVAERQQQGRRRRRGRGRGPRRGGAELLARPRPGQERVDAGDGHPVAVLHVACHRTRINHSVYVRTCVFFFEKEAGALPCNMVSVNLPERRSQTGTEPSIVPVRWCWYLAVVCVLCARGKGIVSPFRAVSSF
jgi:hypothetical protein